jgi:Zn-dependent metalloprotease
MRILALVTVATLCAACSQSSDSLTSSESADLVVSALSSSPQLANGTPADTFVIRDVVNDEDGTQHVRMDRFHGGLPVIGGDLVAHADATGAIESVTHALDRLLAPKMVLTLDQVHAVALAVGRRGSKVSTLLGESAEQVIYARDGVQTLAWDVLIVGEQADGTPVEQHQLVDGDTGKELDRWDGIETTATGGTGKAFFAGTTALTVDKSSSTYFLRDPSRGGQYTNDMKKQTAGNGTIFSNTTGVFGTGAISAAATAAADAQIGTMYTWDYYKTVHGRNGIGKDGKGAYNRVHYGTNFANAFWSDSCFCMTYGDGDGSTLYPLTSIDVAGHEMSHGVTSRTANLVYSGESGGLNEATSDIFGTMVEFFANLKNEVPNYLIGEKLFMANGNKPSLPETGSTKAIRYMWKPSLDGASPDCWSSAVGGLDVHYSSAIGNHFFYLLAEGTSPTDGHPQSQTCDNKIVRGLGRAAAEKIWYRALTVYLTSTSSYKAARAATIKAAGDLYGASSAQAAAVAAAWSGVNVN